MKILNTRFWKYTPDS